MDSQPTKETSVETENKPTRRSFGKALPIILIAAVVSALAAAAVQRLLFDEINAAMTGGVTGAVVGAIVPLVLNRNSK